MDLGWIHQFHEGTSAMTLLLLHGTGGDETSLVELAREWAPGAKLLSVRGRSLEEGSPRFFRRFTATTYDQPHLIQEADALALFVEEASSVYGFAANRVVAFGYSNGANIALASLSRNPIAYRGAVLLRPVMALETPPQVDLTGKSVLVTQGMHDSFLPFGKTVVPYLKSCGAEVRDERIAAGHGLTPQDREAFQEWWREL